jgi:hypothetical protein
MSEIKLAGTAVTREAATATRCFAGEAMRGNVYKLEHSKRQKMNGVERVVFCANSTNVGRKKIGWRGRRSVWRQF